MDDEPAGPWGLLVSGALVSFLGIFMLANSGSTGEALLGGLVLWIGAVLTIAGAVRLGLPPSLTRGSGPRVSGPGERRIP